MKKLLLFALALTSACATTDIMAVVSHDAVSVGDQTWGDHVETRMAVCKTQPDPASCIEPTAQIDDKVGVSVVAYVVALRAYWFSRSGGDKVGMVSALRAMAQAVQSLPPEYFGAAQKVLKGAK